MYYYNGYKVYITKGIEQQKRRHKKKRINKKWLKRYGTIKIDATKGQIMIVSSMGSIFMNMENFQILQKNGSIKEW